ncbi:MAG: hypothetical protein AB8G11_05615 [Saprospiraceae bacterium]
MNRKQFLSMSALAAFSVSCLGKVKKTDNDDFKGDCETTNDILGPFYRENAPIQYDMTFENLKGSVIELKGKVYQSDCETVIENALVEIWHCDTEGNYDNDSADYKHRARWKTDENGKYAFKTILPGKYLNGQLFRPAHIHFRVTAVNQKELISQIYFHGDPHIQEDHWASQQKAQHRILPIILEDTSGNLAVNFDIYLSEK